MRTIFKVLPELLQYHVCTVLVHWQSSMWDSTSPTRNQPHTPCIGRWSPICWTTRKVPNPPSFIGKDHTQDPLLGMWRHWNLLLCHSWLGNPAPPHGDKAGLSKFHSVFSGEWPARPEQLHGERRMGDQGVEGLEALGVLRMLPLHPLPGHHLPLRHAAPSPLLHRQRHHPLPALLLLDWPGVLPAHRLRWVQLPWWRLLTLMDHALLF